MIAVAGAGWVTAAGLGRARESGELHLAPGALQAPSRRAVFADAYSRFGRLDDFSKVGLAAVTLALRDAGMEEWGAKRPIGIACATLFGCLATDVAYLDTVIPQGGALASPNLFAYTLPNAFLGEAAIRHGLTGPTVALLGDGGGMGAVAMAVECLRSGGCEAMVAGICDVAPPAPLAPPDGFAPGALFVVLRKPSEGDGRIGELRVGRHGGFSLGGRSVTDIPTLVRACA
jgi:3-oxoacyl-[acyl-carrier-protein] synthase II